MSVASPWLLLPLAVFGDSFLRVLRVLRGKKVYHHEEHEGHEVFNSARQARKESFLIFLLRFHLSAGSPLKF
jgi:hypothetical protein